MKFSLSKTYFMAGGGTGGHVIPAVAVARELKARAHQPIFVGTRAGFEARLVPAAGFPIEFIEIGGLQRVGFVQTLRTLSQLPASLWRCLGLIKAYRPSAIFSMGGYVSGPVTLAAWVKRVPIVIMEPNAVPGLANRLIGRFVRRALVSFDETRRYFPAGRSEVTGLPVRQEFSALTPKPPGAVLTVLVTGGSRGSRTLNNATREAWPLFRDAPFHVSLIHQTGADAYDQLSADFKTAGIPGEVLPFIADMAAAFNRADIVVCRSGAGAVSEIAASGKPSILVPFPFAADDHQLKNAEQFAKIDAARLVLDREMNGPRLYDEIARLAAAPEQLERMGHNARSLAPHNAAVRAADVLEEIS
jgi:UDP-N-acetylglucosamine--N-acetylmuramyl-(pentapeptide) pyrophosphoryl-undecaprenol N-acetylglucosamine transferase